MNVFLDGISFKNDMLVGGVVGQDASQGTVPAGGHPGVPRHYAAVQSGARGDQRRHQRDDQVGVNEWQGEVFLVGQTNALVAEDYFTIKAARWQGGEPRPHQPGAPSGQLQRA